MPKLTANSSAARSFLSLIADKAGELRASKPKDGNATYVWRMVAFSVSDKPRHHCMPVTADFGVTVPVDYLPEAPLEWLNAEVVRSSVHQHDADFCRSRSPDGTIRGYHAEVVWKTFSTSGRQHHFVKNVLDPVVKELVDSVPLSQQGGTLRWARAYGVI